MTESGGETSIFGQNFGRSGETQTRGPRIPNAVRYQLRHTPIYSIFFVIFSICGILCGRCLIITHFKEKRKWKIRSVQGFFEGLEISNGCRR